ncbi:MAG: MFS transporter [Terracidiphilus sp.]|nr:MFS transporter [Terracidiphilus sp.]
MTISKKITGWTGPRRQLILVILLFLVATINYFDRQSLSVVAPRLQAELHIDEQGYAHIVGLFLLASAIAYAAAGFITDWLGTRRAMALFVGWWSLAEAATMLASNMFSLGLARFCLGLGEPGLWVAAPKAVGEAIGERKRALAIGIYSMGGSVGAVVALPAIALVTSHLPWRSIFVIDGAVGLLWLPLWFWATRSPHSAQGEVPESGPANRAPAPGEPMKNLRAVLTSVSTWKLVAARGFTDPVWYFYLFWFPKYLVSSRHMTLGGLAHFAWFVYLGGGIGAVTGGLFASLLIRRGMRVRIAYRWTMLAAALILPLSPLTAIVSSNVLAVLIAALIAFAHMNWLVILTAIVVELYPPNQVGTAAGLIASGSGLGGMLSSELIGYVVMHQGYTPLFFVMGVLHPMILVSLWRVFEQREA